jgi:small multidrug resistance pump
LPGISDKSVPDRHQSGSARRRANDGRVVEAVQRRSGTRPSVAIDAIDPVGRPMSVDWLFLAGAIVLEVAGTISMKLSQGFTRLLPSVLLFVFYIGAFTCLNFALRSIEVGVAYAIWCALGIVLVSAIGMFVFSESAGAFKLGCLAVIVAGVVGLYWSGGGH